MKEKAPIKFLLITLKNRWSHEEKTFGMFRESGISALKTLQIAFPKEHWMVVKFDSVPMDKNTLIIDPLIYYKKDVKSN